MNSITRKTKNSYDVNNSETHRVPAAENPEEQKRPTKTCVAYRYYIASLAFMSFTLVNGQRIALAFAVVEMSNHTSPMRQNLSTDSCPVFNDSTPDSVESKGRGDFDWDSEVQGFIIASSFLGNALIQCIAGPLVNVIGTKKMLFWAQVVCALTMLLSPLLSWWHVYSLITAHFIRSLAQGCAMPANYAVMASWTPRGERGFISSFMITGYYTGSVVGGLLSGYLCELLGWQSVFYFFGGVGCLFSVQFGLTFYETPKDHPRISETELQYITGDQVSTKSTKKLSTPWIKMFTSIPTYALMYALFGTYWSMYYFLSVHPAYMNTILHFPIAQSGLFFSLPFLMKIASSLLSSSLSDWLYRKKLVGVDKLRKGCNFLGCLGFTLSSLGIYFAKCNKLANVLFHATTMLSCGLCTAGSLIAAGDMTPNFSGPLMGIAGTFSNMGGVIIPLMVGYLTKDQTMENWHTVFFINIAVVMSSGIVFAVFGSAEVQPWNFVEEKRDTTMKESAAEGNAGKEDGDASEKRIKYIQPK